MAWGNKTQIASNLSVSNSSEVYSDTFTLKPKEFAHVQVYADFPSSPTDDLEVKVYTTLDDSSENWDTRPFYSFEISNDQDHYVSFVLCGIYKARLGFKKSGSASETITVSAWIRKDGGT